MPANRPQTRLDQLDRAFDDHPSIMHSLEDLEATDFNQNSPASLHIPSQHSGFRSEDSEAESASDSAYAPPWRRAKPSGWFQNRASSPSLSRESSVEQDDEDPTIAANVPLPGSPEKQRSPSPSPDADTGNARSARPSVEPIATDNQAMTIAEAPNSPNNYLLWSMHFKFRHRTEPFEAAWVYMWNLFERMTKSRSSITFTAAIILTLAVAVSFLTRPLERGPAPDLVKVAGLAKSFESLIHYSESGVQQIGDLQETGVAVWDLGESIRSTNMTSAPIITRSLDELSESLKTLGLELTRFFANVDGDVDSILIVMDWAKRELTQVSTLPLGSLTSAFDNMHQMLSRLGVLESSNGTPTTVGKVIKELFGQTHVQRTKAALQRTFNEFLGVLEESINSELTYSTALFGLFEAIDRQFLNLQRTVIRETDQQEREEGEMLASLWTRVLGGNASALRKYERNLKLLQTVRDKTIKNKHILVDHNGKLLKLKTNLEILRKKLVSPLVRSNDSSTLSIEEQIHGLDGTYEHLKAVRDQQKEKLLKRLYGSRHRSSEIEGSMTAVVGERQ